MESENLAWKIRRDVLEMVHAAHASHVGSAFSVADIVAVLYNDFANLEQLKSGDKERTRIILSKGHAGAAIYAALAEVGLMDKSELQTYGTNGSKLSCHVSHKGVKGVDGGDCACGEESGTQLQDFRHSRRRRMQRGFRLGNDFVRPSTQAE